MALLGDRNIISYTYHRQTGWYNRQSTSWGEVSTDYRITVVPKRSDSLIVIKYQFGTSTPTMHALNQHRIYNVTDSSVPNEPTQGSGQNRALAHCTTRGQYNADNARNINMTASLASWSGTKVFTVHTCSWNSDVVRHLHSAGNSSPTVHWSNHLWAEAWELEDI